jgi:peptide/nickel transport system permease protein
MTATRSGPWTLARRRFFAHPLAALALVTLVLLALLAAAAPLIGMALGTDADTVDLIDRFEPPSASHLLGTDELGRDVLLRLLQGGRASLLVGAVAAGLSASIGTAVGLVAGYFGGRIDVFAMRIADGMLSLPLLPLLIVLAALDPRKLGLPSAFVQSPWVGVLWIVLIVSLFGWTTVARLVRAHALALREETFVLAARAQGASAAHIMRVHILPNLASTVVVAATLSAGNIILLESVLSFLGLGIQPPTPSWGNLLTNAQELVWTAPRLAVWPGMLILLTVISLNLVGDGLREALDPRTASR